MTYDVNYFLAKFQNTRDDQWCMYTFQDEYGRCCALGWCGMGSLRDDIQEVPEEAISLLKLFRESAGLLTNLIANINDGHDKRYQQPTPKERILAALMDIKNKQETDNAVEEAKNILAETPCAESLLA